MTIGMFLILLAIALAFGWVIYNGLVGLTWYPTSFILYYLYWRTTWMLLVSAAVVMCMGVFSFTKRENYPPADEADARLRWVLWLATVMPLLLVALIEIIVCYDSYTTRWYGRNPDAYIIIMPLALALSVVPLPPLLFYRLRGLAKRAHSAHLAEHCAIVGIGAALSLVYFIALIIALHWRGDDVQGFQSTHSITGFVLVLALTTAAGLFILWSLYLMTRFAIAFARATRALRRKWISQDLAVV